MAKNVPFQDELHERTFKSYVLIGIMVFFFVFLAGRLFYLQIVQAKMHIEMSKANQSRFKILKAPRGRIFDRNGLELANNRPSYSICILPYKVDKKASIISKLLKIVDSSGVALFDSLDLVDRVKKANMRRFETTRLKEDVSLDIVSIIEEHSMELPGILVQIEARREYTLGPMTFHVLGYMSEIPEELFDSLKEEEYHYGDMIGKAGLEKQYEPILRGRDGFEYIEVNAFGRSMGPIALMPRLDPIPGDNLYLTIDAAMQRVIADAFPDSLKGAVVVVDPKDGGVLAMLSNPSLDPNIFSLAATIRSKSWAEAAKDTNLPLNNRAISCAYPPGSTFKVVSALAGLASKRISPDATMPYSCTGAFRFGNRIAHCWYDKGHGRLKLIDALKVSCNIYFYQVGLTVGDQIINSYARQLGLGEYSGIDIPGENCGWLSGEESYNKKFASRGWKWTRGLVLDLAIGQTELVTPLQLAILAGGVGNGTRLYKPFLLNEEKSYDGILMRKTRPTILSQLTFDTTDIKLIHSGMEEVITGAGGTGHRAGFKGVPIGGKTGSAQNPHGEKTHALFMACAPVDDPVIAVGIVVENAGHGGTVAAPIAGAIFKYFFSETDEGRSVVEQYLQKQKGGSTERR